MQSHIMDFPHPLLMKTENILRESKLELSMSQIPGLTEIIEMVFMTYFFRLLNSILSHCCYCVFALRGCLHDTGATFAPGRVHSGSLSWLYICLHDTTTKCNAGASHPGVRISLRCEISQRYHVNAKRAPISV